MILTFIIPLILLFGCTEKKTTPDISGILEGKVQFPGFSYKIVFLFSTDNNLQAEVLFQDQSDKKFSASSIEFSYPEISFKFDQISGQFSGKFEEVHLIGTWEQAQRTMPLRMNQVKEISSPARPQTPQSPFPYHVKEVSFNNNDIHISGTLTYPENVENYPVVILIPGVGAHERDNTFFGHRPFFVIADFLTRNGIAVLRYDERGVGSSTGDRSQANAETFAQDVISGVNYLRSLPQIEEIGLIGHSEGGTIASLVAAQYENISFIVMMGSPGLKGVEYNLQFEESMSRALGATEDEIEKKLNFQKRVLTIILQEESSDSAAAKIDKLYLELDPNIPEKNRKSAIQRFLSPWFKYNIAYDPAETLQLVRCPVLALFGERDMQVPPERNLTAMKNALIMSGNPDSELKELPELNHYFQTAKSGRPDEYRLIEETISPIALEIINNWIQKRTIKNNIR